ncbi:MAG: nucleotidyltransferase domain-containing protein [Candidatus Doudnabacteria bacterium]|nr:nucleotidyltransferase domain-containing protein [Candidatus Doudnabacteria bacterium]
MLEDRILSTLRFFDLQDYPLTLLELQQFLMEDEQVLKQRVDSQFEINNIQNVKTPERSITSGEILRCVEEECQGQVEEDRGFYYLRGKNKIVQRRLQSYNYGLKREQLIRKFVWPLRHLPFVRGVALAGSQAMGLYKSTSDIDLLIITDPKFLWLARSLVTAYFQVIGQRRHGSIVIDRFCLNHYLAGPKKISKWKNLYTAWEYLKLRPLVYRQEIYEFQSQNLEWLKIYFPNFVLERPQNEKPSGIQRVLEGIFTNRFGLWLEKQIKKSLSGRIRKEPYILVEEDELSFHPNSAQQELLRQFFKNEQ